jgi:hypothetical protein
VTDGIKADKRVAIVQSNYIPWKGYFDLIDRADEFILLDDVQYTRRDWRNRNRIKTANGVQWLTIPVETKGRYFQAIKDILVGDPRWNQVHWKTLSHHYSRAPYFREYRAFFEDLYLGADQRYLSEVNHRFLTAICGLLGIDTQITWSSDYELADEPTERLLHLCRQAGAREYISGPAARAYLNEERFRADHVAVRYIDYTGYPEYDQLYPPFEHGVSILDLVFSTGPDAIAAVRRS